MATTVESALACTREEVMVVTASRLLRDGDVVFVGIGLPNLACNLAKRLHAPSLHMVYESGIFGAHPERQALSIGDPCLVTGAACVTSLTEIFLFYLQRGLIDVGFLSGAQVDRHGNLNTTAIGGYERPRVRLPGSGGASGIATNAKRVFIIGRQSRKTFVEKVEFITSCGHRPGGGPPAEAPGGGPQYVVTDLAVYTFRNGEMVVATLHSGVTSDEIRANTGWAIDVPEAAVLTPPPTLEELRILRDELDSKGRYLSRRGGQLSSELQAKS
jgi:glutaconate CoA-transferase subunit B